MQKNNVIIAALLVFFAVELLSAQSSEINTDDFKKRPVPNWQKNPFVKAKSVLGSDIKVLAIVFRPEHAAALVNKQIVTVGDSIGKYRVLAIESDAVILRDDHGVVRLGIDGEKR
jgi:hypothetical protein